MRVGVAATQVPFLRDGGEARAAQLVQALRRAGHEAEIIPVPFNGRPDSRLPEQMLACRLLDLEESVGTRIDRLVGMTFPSYLIPHPAKVIWLLRRCRAAYDLWGTPYESLHAVANGEQLRWLVRDADARLIPEARDVFVPSSSAVERLRADCGIPAKLLRAPPPCPETYQHRDDGDFFLLPAPAGHPSRETLVLRAMRHTRHPVRLCVLAGSGDPAAENPIQDDDSSLAGRIMRSDAAGETRRALFGSCLAVVCVSLGEVDGMVALEAMLSDKTLITCDDVDGVAELVHDGQTGFVCPPSPERLADILDRIWDDRALARRLGQAARAEYQELRLSWDTVLERLLA